MDGWIASQLAKQIDRQILLLTETVADPYRSQGSAKGCHECMKAITNAQLAIQKNPVIIPAQVQMSCHSHILLFLLLFFAVSVLIERENTTVYQLLPFFFQSHCIHQKDCEGTILTMFICLGQASVHQPQRPPKAVAYLR